MSCPAWNSSKHPNSLFSRLIGNKIHQVSRRHYRKLYRKAAEDWWMGTTGRQTIAQYKSGYHGVNTYPYPYCDNRFADWPESDNPKTYNLISDQSGCVIKYATSYVAWKIFEETGRGRRNDSTQKDGNSFCLKPVIWRRQDNFYQDITMLVLIQKKASSDL